MQADVIGKKYIVIHVALSYLSYLIDHQLAILFQALLFNEAHHQRIGKSSRIWLSSVGLDPPTRKHMVRRVMSITTHSFSIYRV